MRARSPSPSPRIGISACLLGREVRMNGGHCRQRWIVDVLASHAEFVPVCPEVEFGLPTPRPVMRLALTDASRDNHDARLVVSDTGEDLTDGMRSHARARAERLAGENLHGFILKKDSPSCGAFRVKLYDRNGSPSARSVGVFAEELMARLPNLPVEEEGRLNDRELRDAFLVRVFAYAAWRRYRAEDGSAGGLVSFHARYKMNLLACEPQAYRELGRLVARAGVEDLSELQDAYEARFMQTLAGRVTRGRHVNVLQHLAGFCKEAMRPHDKQDLQEVLDLYLDGAVPRAAPLTLVRHLLRTHDAPSWAQDQAYLEPYSPRLVEHEPV